MTTPTTGLTSFTTSQNAMQTYHPAEANVYDRMGEPLQAMKVLGEAFWAAGVGGTKTRQQGEVLALACMLRRTDPFALTQEYHVLDGKLIPKADVLLARFRTKGGKSKWINTGEDGKTAVLWLKWVDEQEVTVTWTIEKARAAGYVKKDSQWEKRPDQMLRARCSTDGVKMLAPEICGGEMSLEEVQDDVDSRGPTQLESVPATRVSAAQLVGVNQEQAATATTTKTKKEKPAKEEPAKAAPATTQSQVTQPADQVIDAEVTPKAGTVELTSGVPDVGATAITAEPAATKQASGELANEPVSDQPMGSVSLATVMKIEEMLTAVGSSREKLEANMKKTPSNFSGATTLENLSQEAAEGLMGRMEVRIAQIKESQKKTQS